MNLPPSFTDANTIPCKRKRERERNFEFISPNKYTPSRRILSSNETRIHGSPTFVLRLSQVILSLPVNWNGLTASVEKFGGPKFGVCIYIYICIYIRTVSTHCNKNEPNLSIDSPGNQIDIRTRHRGSLRYRSANFRRIGGERRPARLARRNRPSKNSLQFELRVYRDHHVTLHTRPSRSQILALSIDKVERE